MVLLEWPDRAAGFLPADRLDIAFTHVAAARRDVSQCAGDRLWEFAARAERMAAVRSFLEESGFGEATRLLCKATPPPAPTSG